MFELSLYILDLVQNSISAGALTVTIRLIINRSENTLTLEIIDDGSGMDEKLLRKVESPFTTTRTTRKVGLGIPMAKQLAEACGGSFSIKSRLGSGTTLTAQMQYDHVDMPPMGSVKDTLITLILGAPDKPEFVFEYAIDEKHFEMDTRAIRSLLGGVPLNTPDVLQWIGEYITEGMAEVEQNP